MKHDRLTPKNQQKKFVDLYQVGKISQAHSLALELVARHSRDPFAWKCLGNCLFHIGDFEEAKKSLETALSLGPEDALAQTTLSRVYFMLGETERAIDIQKSSLKSDPTNSKAHFNLATMLHQAGMGDRALPHLEKAEQLGYGLAEILSIRSNIKALSFKFQEGLEDLEKLYELRPDEPVVHNNLANFHKDATNFEKSLFHYRKAQELFPEYITAYSNELLTLHYIPGVSSEDIFKLASSWHTRFAANTKPLSQRNTDNTPDKKLKVGLISPSFRIHPVGWMITSAIAHLPDDIDIVAYSDSDAEDFITRKIKSVITQWQPCYHLDDAQLANLIQEDEVDILIDLAGHGSGSRLKVALIKPAPIIVKWVGMQISSMAMPSFDYFLSDKIETPEDVDSLYTEKLIRLPDDYICYLTPYYKPSITALPAMENQYITFGCFNNPAKVNDILLRQWSQIMHKVANSRLFLKGSQYSSPKICERVLHTLESCGITRDRITLEGPSNHQRLLESYNRVDISLDTWPYSGGLTTCEALLMGVPVVTRTGPTFAGRHSATHLTNAGMPELVTDNWEEYRARAIGLATDLTSLSIIRATLRTYLEQSPICDGARFGKHLHKALRAIWQRHCEGKSPAALTFNKGGQAWFEDEAKPVKLTTELQHDFDWSLESPVTILDNGAGIATRSDAKELLGSGNIAVLVFDPVNAISNAEELAQYGEIQHFPQVTLGNGQPAMLIEVEGEYDITSLKPLASDIADSMHTLEIPSIALDSIEGLESLDVLALDDRHDNLAILEYGAKALKKVLLLQIRVRFNPTHKNQADLGSLIRWANKHGFRFHRLHHADYHSSVSEEASVQLKQASELVTADALFVPAADRIKKMSNSQRIKLAFLLHQLYGIRDLSYNLLATANSILANNWERFLENKDAKTKPSAFSQPFDSGSDWNSTDTISDDLDKLLR
ncbi:O-linked N-acetylglucosamine transferase family protein [Salinicola rhizosphaerae]|uniref:protein O-GlcNAc transferase n=1 Tax=Salinicola rhizosphaerae TaxID=1443141 RepID=A0ABQ3DP38_9GAMM|nr:tetratricopeptide repeat protein [Salinicola rhizosphaerae]GHB10066.1 hypothetical protein GCM10009038_04760 [Salinicola rhizosphaerae]